MANNTYEVLETINFGYKHVRKDGAKLRADDQPENTGKVHPTPEGEENPTVTLSDEQAAQLLEVGAIKPAGEKDTSLTQNPEDDGYQGEAERDAQLSNTKKSNKKSS